MNFEIISQLVISATVVIFAARWLAHSSDEIAKATGLGHLFVGSIFLAASTSAPEFFVDIRATLQGIPNLAAGDLLGSSLMNLIIFSTLAFIYGLSRAPSENHGIWVSSLLAAILTAEIGLLILLRPGLMFLNLSLGSFVIVGTYLAGMRFIYRKTRSIAPASRVKLQGMLRPVLKFFLAATALFFASPLLVGSMEVIATKTGLGNTFIGATLLAFTTSLPELISSATALRMKLFDLVLGNIIGSNIFNMMIFVFMDWFWSTPPIWAHLSQDNILISAVVTLNMILLGITWGFSYSKPAPVRLFGTSAVLLISLGCYLALFLI